MAIREVTLVAHGFHSNTEGSRHGIDAVTAGRGLAMTADMRLDSSDLASLPSATETCLGSFRGRLLWAMEHILPNGRTTPFREPEIITLIHAGLDFRGQPVNPPELRTAYRMSSTYLNDLVRGRKDRPSGEKLAVISGFFNTTVSFFAPYGSPDCDLDFVVRYAHEAAYARDVALDAMYLLAQQAEGLTPASLAALSKYADFLRSIQEDPGSKP